LLDTICTPTKAQLDTCEVVRQYVSNPTRAAMYNLHAGNVTYYHFLSQNVANYPQMAIVFIQHAIHLFEGLSIMHANKFYHLDIQDKNIILGTFSDSTLRPRFIDFGISFDATKYPSFDEANDRWLRHADHPYGYAPPENQILIDAGNLFQYDLWVNSTAAGEAIPEHLINRFATWFREALVQYGRGPVAPWLYVYPEDFTYSAKFVFETLPEVQKKQNTAYLHDMFQHMDVYMLSAVFVRAMKSIKDQYDFSKQFWEILKKGVDPEYQFRPTASQMKELLQSIRFPRAIITTLDQVPETSDLPFLTTVRGSQFSVIN